MVAGQPADLLRGLSAQLAVMTATCKTRQQPTMASAEATTDTMTAARCGMAKHSTCGNFCAPGTPGGGKQAAAGAAVRRGTSGQCRQLGRVAGSEAAA